MVDSGRDSLTAPVVAPATASRLYERAGAARWGLDPTAFAAAIERSVARACTGTSPSSSDVGRYLDGLHLEDLALAAACQAGLDAAWEHFILEYRPALYRAAAAIDRTGDGRDLADGLYADLFGLETRDGERRSLFRYFHGRSSLASWVRAVLAQRHVDRLRAGRRLRPLPDDDAPGALGARPDAADPDGGRSRAAMAAALAAALAALAPRDRLRLTCYYVRGMRLAAIGRLLGEHEATVSRHLTRTRQQIRRTIEEQLARAGYDEAAVTECFRTVAGDSGEIDLGILLDAGPPRKNGVPDRSQEGGS